MIALHTIVVATDFGDAAQAALRYGCDFARTFSATVHVVHVVEDVLLAGLPAPAMPMEHVTTIQADLEADARRLLDALITDDDRRSLDIHPVVIGSPQAARALLDFARDHRADLIIVGTHGRGALAEFFLGSVAQRVVRSATCPVLTVRAAGREFIQPDALTVVEPAQS